MIGGKYLGEILRLAICGLVEEGVLFQGQDTTQIEKLWAFETEFMSFMERYENFSNIALHNDLFIY
jgi:hexokinase